MVLQFNLVNLHRVMKDFYTLTKIRIVLIDAEYNEKLSYPKYRFDFCSRIRKNVDVEKKCNISDMQGCRKSAETKEAYIYCCHAGLVEAVVPIIDTNGIIGYIMFGQILREDIHAFTKVQLKKNFNESIFPGIVDVIDQIPIKTTDEINAAATVLRALAVYAMSNAWVVPGKSEFTRQLDHYIKQHMEQNITAKSISEELNIGRTKLYDLATSYLGMGIAEYVRKQRIEYAKKLLSNTKRSITDIACSIGFSDYNHFLRIFKKECGMSARQYRDLVDTNKKSR